MITIAIVDDHPAVRAGVAAMLDGLPDVGIVGEAGDVTAAIRLCSAMRPDVVLMDLRLGDDDGVAAIAALAQSCPNTRALVLTTYDGDEAIHRALAAGARGYVLKHSTADEIELGVRAVAAGRRYIPDAVARKLLLNGPRVTLTPREQDVLELLADGYRTKEIGARLGMGDATVRSHVQAILAKFDCHDRGAAIAIAIARGFFATRPTQVGG